MPRIVRHDATGPIKIDPKAAPGTPNAWPRDEHGNLKTLFICACGISKTFPICDGTHKICVREEPGAVYEYDRATNEATKKD